MRIAIEGREAAEAWKREAQELNEETQTLLNEVSELLKSVRDFSEGTLVDEIVDLGSNLVTATTKLMEGMNMIFDVVNNLLNILMELFNNASANTKDTNQYIM